MIPFEKYARSITQASGIADLVVSSFLAGQYLYFFMLQRALFIAVLGEFYVVCLLVLLSAVAINMLKRSSRLARWVGGIIHALFFLGLLVLVLLFNGPFVPLLLLLELLLAGLNLSAFLAYWRCWETFQAGHSKTGATLGIQGARARSIPIRGLIGLACVVAIGFVLLNSFWGQITIRAPDNAKTTCSYWADPDLTLQNWTSEVTPVDNWTLQLVPGSFSPTPPDFVNGSLAYVDVVDDPLDGLSKNYANYTQGARSYPNGTIFLPDPLPNATANVSVEFHYVQNWPVLAALNDTGATVILNGFGTYVTVPDPFVRVHDTFLFQLMDYWSIKFYISVSVNNEFSHVFNYINVTPLANLTLTWASQWTQFQGVSFDCEQEEYPQSPLNRPGYFPLVPGAWIPDNWSLLKRTWYWENEQNATLYHDAWVAYDNVFQHAANLGKKVYVVLGPSDFSEYIDGDQDYHANPTLPLSQRANVLYGQMSYHDSDPTNGRFACYRDCLEQIQVLGNRGTSILLGWLARDVTYYTSDEVGFQRYVEDCLIAQAAGMAEIFHAPLSGMQGKWGDDSITRLHQALNEHPKQTLVVPIRQFTNYFAIDFWKNFNQPWLFLGTASVFLGVEIVIMRRSRSLKKNAPNA